MRINQYELGSIKYVRRCGPMWRTSDADGRKLLLTLHTQTDHIQNGEQWSRWAGLDSPYVVHLHDVICSEDGRWALVQEEIQGQTLAMHCETRSELLRLHAETLIKQIRLGVKALHDGGIVHGDITARNILVTDEPRAVIIDLLESVNSTDYETSSKRPMFGKEVDALADENDTEMLPHQRDIDRDDKALKELISLIRDTVHAPGEAVASTPEDPGARLRAQAQLPVTQVRQANRRWWPIKTRLRGYEGDSISEIGVAARNEYETEEQLSTPAEETRKAPKTKASFSSVGFSQNARSQALSPIRIVIAGAVVASLLGGWGTVQLWMAYADGPLLSPQAKEETQVDNEKPTSEQKDYTSQSASLQKGPESLLAPVTQRTTVQEDPENTPMSKPGEQKKQHVTQCPNRDLMRSRLNAILHARDNAYIKQNLSELELYLSPELIAQDQRTVETMRSKQTNVTDFHTTVTDIQDIRCQGPNIDAEVLLAVDAYTVCDPEKCVDVAATQPSQEPLHLRFSAEDMILLSVSPASN